MRLSFIFKISEYLITKRKTIKYKKKILLKYLVRKLMYKLYKGRYYFNKGGPSLWGLDACGSACRLRGPGQ